MGRAFLKRSLGMDLLPARVAALALAAHEKATKEAERQRQRLLQAFQNAHPTEEFRFPDQWSPVAPSPATEQSPSKQPGAGTGLLPPRLEPPRFMRSKRPGF